jgi:HAD superfamily hydrolase (TIGR01509 family)
MIRAVIFDMDGVIVDSERHWVQFDSIFIVPLVGNLDPSIRKRISGMSIENLYSMLKRDCRLALGKEEFFEAYDIEASHMYREKVELTPGCLQLIRSLKAAGFALGLASSANRAWIRMVLERFSLETFFGAVVSAEDVRGQGKPDPAVFLRAAELLQVPPGECLVIEDAANGAEAAKRAGMYCVGFMNGFNDGQDLSAADKLISDFSELTVENIPSFIPES